MVMHHAVRHARRCEQRCRRTVEPFKISGVVDNSGRVAIAPFDRDFSCVCQQPSSLSRAVEAVNKIVNESLN